MPKLTKGGDRMDKEELQKILESLKEKFWGGKEREERFLKFWEFLAWADKARWKNKMPYLYPSLEKAKDLFEGLGEGRRDLTTPQLVLSHWLTYIFDYQMPAKQVWSNCLPIASYIAVKFLEGVSAEKILTEVKKDGRVEKGKFSFKHHFGTQPLLLMDRTLRWLESNGERDLLNFMFNLSEGERWVRRVATGLYLLTYDKKASPEDVFDKKRFEERFNERFDYETEEVKKGIWHKRLWSAFRDYLKGEINKAIVEEIPKYKVAQEVLERWKNPELDQLELPNDSWNKKFFSKFEHLLPTQESIRRIDKPPLRRENLNKALRYIYAQEKDEAKKRGLYPEQFDVSWDLAQRCEREEFCWVCPLNSKGKVKKLCIAKEEKYCPVLLVFFRYYVNCSQEGCPVLKDKFAGLCGILFS